VKQRRSRLLKATLLAAACGANDFEVFPFEYRPCSVEEIASSAHEFVAAVSTPSGHDAILRLLELVPRAVRQLRALDLRIEMDNEDRPAGDEGLSVG
jgi:hypothetical protein